MSLRKQWRRPEVGMIRFESRRRAVIPAVVEHRSSLLSAEAGLLDKHRVPSGALKAV